MNLDNLYKTDATEHPALAAQEFLRGLMVRTNLVPGVRHMLGWRGVKDSSRAVEAWSARVAGYSGIFGMVFDEAVIQGTWCRGRFHVCYFPHAEENLMEQVAVQAAMVAAQPGFLDQVRDFTAHEHLLDLFNVGVIELGIDTRDQGVTLAVESLDRQQVICHDGIEIDGTSLVPPGGFDQDFPAWEICLNLFRALAASLSFNLAEAPGELVAARRPGWIRVLGPGEEISETVAPENPCCRLRLAWGSTPLAFDPAWTNWPEARAEMEEEIWWTAHQISDIKAVDKNALGIDERPRLVIVTGFLGSGKTTFLQNFIDHMNRNNRFVAVIQNEIGEVGLDGGLLDHDYAVTEIDEGCICCTLVGNLKTALRQVMTEFHPDTIMLETTGLANPLNLLDELTEVADMVAFDSVTTLVDGPNLAGVLEESQIARDQIRAADVVLLNKTDLLDADQVENIEAMISAINPKAPVARVSHGDINPALLYGDDPDQMAAFATEVAAKDADHQHEHFTTCKLEFPNPLDPQKLGDALAAVPSGVFRLKGIVNVVGHDRPQVVQMVAGRFEVSDHPGQEKVIQPGYLVCIGKDLNAETLQALFDEG